MIDSLPFELLRRLLVFVPAKSLSVKQSSPATPRRQSPLLQHPALLYQTEPGAVLPRLAHGAVSPSPKR